MQREALTDLEETALDKTKSGGRTDKGREGAEGAESRERSDRLRWRAAEEHPLQTSVSSCSLEPKLA